MGSESAGDGNETMVVTNAPRRRGNPNWSKGVSQNPAGRPKGAKNKTTILRERLEEFKFDPVVKLIKAYEEIDDPVQRAKIALELTKGVYEVVGKTTNVNVNEKSVQIVWQFGTQPDQAQIEQMEVDLGIKAIDHKPAPVMGQVIEETDDVMVEKE